MRAGAVAVLFLAATLAPVPVAQAGGSRVPCDITVAVENRASLETLEVAITYPRPQVFWPDANNKIRCRALTPGAAVVASDKLGSGSGVLTVGFAAFGSVETPASLFSCTGQMNPAPTPGSFNVVASEATGVYATTTTSTTSSTTTTTLPGATSTTISSATTSTLPPPAQPRGAFAGALMPPPRVSVVEVRCDSVTTTTTTSTTTSLGSVTTTTLVPEECRLTLGLGASPTLERLGLVVGYDRAGGGFPGASCEALVAAGIATDNDTTLEELTVNFISLAGFNGPRSLATCTFVPTRFIPDLSRFDIAVTGAFGDGNDPVSPLPAVTATALDCPSLSTTTTTTSTTLPPPRACGDVDGDGEVRASDALAVLRAAVGLGEPCPVSVCDAAGGGSVRASDALRVLQVAVGRDVPLLCPVV
jgi:hypothetical protein